MLGAEIRKAISRADFDIASLVSTIRDCLPAQLADGAEREARRTFLHDSLRDRSLAELTFERVLLGNELQPVAYLERGEIAARAIARIVVRTPTGAERGWGTGFLISPGVLITNNHVLPDPASAVGSLAEFSYQMDLADRPVDPIVFRLDPKRLFHTSEPLDFTVVAVTETSADGRHGLEQFGCLPLLEQLGKAFEGEWLTIVQHPKGERKQLCIRENRLIKRSDDVVWYSTDTLAGSSGSPVFNNDWFVVALHHSGVPEIKNGRWQTVDGQDFDPDTMDESKIKWIANEGIRASRIAQTLRGALPNHPLLRALYAATPNSARISAQPGARPIVVTNHSIPPERSAMNELRRITVELSVDPTTGSVAVNDAATRTEIGTVFEAARKRSSSFDAPFDDDYSKRSGYDVNFLGNGSKSVALPILSASSDVAAPLLDDSKKYVLRYHNYSVVMHKVRRLAVYSAANIDFAHRYDMSRPPDVWRRDPRIAAKHQLENWYYASNKFDRGHLTRREDLEYGSTVKKALASAADTCHWTNCTPQHERFNQNREIWQGIERYILESTILAGNVKAQVITGPILDEGDPVYKDVQYPVQYWKVVAALDDKDKLFATAYIASQEDVIDQYGIEVEPFGPYKTFQVKIAEIERLTGLKFEFGSNNERLSSLDPLERAPARRRRRVVAPTEAARSRAPMGYYEINEPEDIQLV